MEILKSLVLVVALLWPLQSFGAGAGAVSTVAIATADAAVLITASFPGGCVVTVPTTATVPIWFVRADSSVTCSSGITSPAGVRVTAGNGYEFLATDKHNEKICVILDSGTTSVTIDVNTW